MKFAPPTPQLSAALMAMMDKGVSVIVSSCGLDLRPSIMRAVGSVVSADGMKMTVFLSRLQSRQLIQDIASTGRIAVVFSEPISHRTVQLKGVAAQVRSADEDDEAVLERYRRSMEHEVGLVGFDARFVGAMLAYRLEDLVAVSFEASQAFDQTPGPTAGAALAAAPESSNGGAD